MREGHEFRPTTKEETEKRIAELNRLLEMYRQDINPDNGRLSGQDIINAQREIELMEKELKDLQGKNN